MIHAHTHTLMDAHPSTHTIHIYTYPPPSPRARQHRNTDLHAPPTQAKNNSTSPPEKEMKTGPGTKVQVLVILSNALLKPIAIRIS